MSHLPRMRMFAGPNGSGKSTVKSEIDTSLLGFYINPDDIEKSLKAIHTFDLNPLPIQASQHEIITFFKQSGLFPKVKNSEQISCITYQDGIVNFHDLSIDSYLSAILQIF
jgi:predicted ABC-type ATPase